MESKTVTSTNETPEIDSHSVDSDVDTTDSSGQIADSSSVNVNRNDTQTASQLTNESNIQSVHVEKQCRHIISLSTDITNNKDVSAEVTDRQDVSNKVTDSKDVSSKVTDSKDVSSKVTDNEDVSFKVTDSKDVSNKVTDSKDLSNKVTDSKDVSNKVTDSKDVSNKVTENVEVSTKVIDSKDMSKKVTENVEVSTKVTENKNVSNKLIENKDVSNKVTDFKDLSHEVTKKRDASTKHTDSKDISNQVTENKDLSLIKVTGSKDVSSEVTDSKDVSYKVTENKDSSDKVTDNKDVPNKVVKNIETPAGTVNKDFCENRDISVAVTNKTNMSDKQIFSNNVTENIEQVLSRETENKSNHITKKEVSNHLTENRDVSDKFIPTKDILNMDKLVEVSEVTNSKNESNKISCKKGMTENKGITRGHSFSSASCNIPHASFTKNQITKVEQTSYEDPLDFSSTACVKLEVQSKESCSVDKPNTSSWNDCTEKPCALDYTISALNRAHSEVSSTSSVPNKVKNNCSSAVKNTSSVIRSSSGVPGSPCDSSSDMNVNVDDIKPLRDQKIAPVDPSKSVLIDTSKILKNTNILLKDTADLLSNTSDLLGDKYLIDTKRNMDIDGDRSTANIDLTPDKQSEKNPGTSSGLCSEVSYSSAEEYKSRHKIGSRRSSENVLTYNNPIIQPYLPTATSPEKSTTKNVLKRKFCVDEIAEHLAKKRAVVSLGERVKDTLGSSFSSSTNKPSIDSPPKGDKSNTSSPVSGEKSSKVMSDLGETSKKKSTESDSEGGKMKVETSATDSAKKGNNSGSTAGNEKKTKSPKTKKKSPKASKKLDVVSFPSRRIKREASLNASARVNIIYEKDMVSPKSRKLSSSSSSSGKSSNKASFVKLHRSISTDSTTSKTSKSSKYNRSKSVGSESIGNKNTKTKSNSNNKNKQKIAKKQNKSTSSDDGLKGKDSGKSKKKPVKDAPGKKVKISKNGNETSKKQKIKATNGKDEKAKKRKSSGETSESTPKKVKIDTQKSARTHVADKPQSDYTLDTPCLKCCQHTCQQSRKYWNGKDDGQTMTIKEEEKISDNNSSLPLDVTAPYPVQTVQLMEGAPFVVPHGHLGPCHACAQGGNILSTSHSYTLGGIGSLSQMMPYHQAYGGGYPVPFAPSSSTPLPHCGCPSCYPTTGVYYPQTSTPITHQPLQHDPCMVPHPVHKPNEESEIIDVVGGESDEDDKQSSLENLSPPIKIEKPKAKKKRSSSNLEQIKKKKKKLIMIKRNTKEKFTKTKVNKKVKKKINKAKKKLKKNVKVKPKIVKKPQYRKSVSRHGWEFEGHPETRKIMCHSVGSMVERSCYPCIRHVDGDVIHVRDCVLLRSGPRKSDIPYVAKVKAFWEDPVSKEMMMSILWYYQPEHIEGGRKTHHLICELFASKHKDENCVACIEDKGYVLTYAEYCRFMAEQRRSETFFPLRNIVVPDSSEEYPGKNKLPTTGVDPNTVYVCRQVYDFKLKRILKNPS